MRDDLDDASLDDDSLDAAGLDNSGTVLPLSIVAGGERIG